MGIYSVIYWTSTVCHKTLVLDPLWQTCHVGIRHLPIYPWQRLGDLKVSKWGPGQPTSKVRMGPLTATRALQKAPGTWRPSAPKGPAYPCPGRASDPGQPPTGSRARRRRVPALRGAALTRRASTRGWRRHRGYGCWGTPSPQDGWKHRG